LLFCVVIQDDIAMLRAESISIALAADIWGENGIALFAVLAYWIDGSWALHEKLILCKPFSDVSPTQYSAF